MPYNAPDITLSVSVPGMAKVCIATYTRKTTAPIRIYRQHESTVKIDVPLELRLQTYDCRSKLDTGTPCLVKLWKAAI